MKRSSPVMALMLPGCTGAGEAAGIVALLSVGLIVVALLTVPMIAARLKDREHHRRMYRRRPFSDQSRRKPKR